MAAKITIQKQSGESVNIITDGFIVLYFEPGDEKITVVGDIDIKALTPVLTKIALMQLSKKMGVL